MDITDILVLIIGLGTSVFVYVWFLTDWGKNDEIGMSSNTEIIVDGGYNPSVIRVKKNDKTQLTFHRKDPSSCLDEVIIPDLKMSFFLPLNQKTSVTINPLKSGEIGFYCGMRMFHGKIIVTD
jgi:plastocyanin domain-containing protein